MPEPINSLESHAINGVEHWLLIQSEDVRLPILVVLHGGPGYAILPLLHQYNRALERHFVVVNYDQRGAGRSYRPGLSLRLDDYLNDLKSLTAMISARFARRKVYLLGHSWGALLGLHAARRWPEDYEAFFGVGQVVSVARNEVFMYDWALGRARETRNALAVEQLEHMGRPDGQGIYPGGDERAYDVAERWMAHFGGDLWRRRSTSVIDDWLLGRPEYSGKWGTRWRRGLADSARAFEDREASGTDFGSSAASFDLPVYFFQGVHDHDTPAELVAEYFPKVSAPRKGLSWFEKSAHFPFYEEPGLFHERLIGLLSTGL